jgi:chromosome segregation ATPase
MMGRVNALASKSPIASLKIRQAEVTHSLEGQLAERKRLAAELQAATARHLYHGDDTDREQARLRKKIADLDHEIAVTRIDADGLRVMEPTAVVEDAQLRLREVEKQRANIAKEYLQGLRERRSLAAQLTKIEARLADLAEQDRQLFYAEATALTAGATNADGVPRQRLPVIEATADAVQRDTDRTLFVAAKLGLA